jgi:hypothetical protein
MNPTFTSTLKEIESSEAFINFKKTNKDAKLCAGFFIIDYQQEQNQKQLDYCLENKDIFTFVLDREISIKKAETIEGMKQELPELNREIRIDLDEAEKILQEKIKQEKVENKLLKIIAVLQIYEEKQIWNLNCMLEGLDILRVHIDVQTGEVIKFEKRNMMEFVKKVK